MSTYRTTSRIDYICVLQSEFPRVRRAWVEDGIDLSLSESVDHRLVVADCAVRALPVEGPARSVQPRS
eukprot:7899123-Pyramimonas_sp.AAC.1